MTVAQTSLLAYAQVKSRLNGRRLQVYEAIKMLEPVDNLRISEYLELPINQITGRVNELMHMGLIQEEMKAKNRNGREAIFWSHKNLNDDNLVKIARENKPEWEYDRKGNRNR